MNRFLKKQWDDTRIPEGIRRRASQRAWDRLHARRGPVPKLALGAAALASLLALVWLAAPGPTPVPRATPTELPLTATTQDPVSTLPPARLAEANLPPRPRPAAERRNGAARPPDEASTGESASKPQRLVLNFTLPESGVRMIWVQDPNFLKQPGGTE